MSTPLTFRNRSGLSALDYRVGRYGDFFGTMLMRLAGRTGSAAAFKGLTTRSRDDPAIALLEAFACVADVLTFYQERLANEGYLGTATERRSLTELANLTGYRPRPGVDAAVYLAYTLQPGGAVTIPAGSRAQSVPGPGATAQMFETSDDLDARPEWNAMRPRLLRPTQPGAALGTVFLQGTDTVPKIGDALLAVANGKPTLYRATAVETQFDKRRVQVTLSPSHAAARAPQAIAPANAVPAMSARQAVPAAARRTSVVTRMSRAATPAAVMAEVASAREALPAPSAGSMVASQAEKLRKAAIEPPARYPSSPQLLRRSAALLFAPQTETALAVKTAISPQQQSAVYQALGRYTVGDARSLELHAFRANTAPFGSRAPLQVIPGDATHPLTMQEWTLNPPFFNKLSMSITASAVQTPETPSTGLVSPTGIPLAKLSPPRVIAMVITIDASTVPLSVAERQGQSATQTLSPSLGRVTATVTHFAADPAQITLTIEFPRLALTVVVAQVSGQAATASATGAGAVALTLTAREQQTVGPTRLIVEGSRPAGAIVGGPTQGKGEAPDQLFLDGVFETVAPDSWVAFDLPDEMQDDIPQPLRAHSASTVTRVAYGQVARTTRLVLDGTWIDPAKDKFDKIRNLAVFADSVKLTLAPEDVTEPVAQTGGDASLELGGLYPGLAAGRYVLVSGERDDLPGVIATELVMIAGAEHTLETSPLPDDDARGGQEPLAGETVHTVLTFSSPLAYSYKRDTVTIYGNVVRATQGESQNEVLGSGNGTVANQSFMLKKPPLTFLSAATESGSVGTLRVIVNGVAWTELPELTQAGPDDRVYVVQIADTNAVTVRFGDGVHGARLPSGVENVRAQYRSGLGLSGNVGAGTITTLMSRPLGVQAVTNPQPATGGADRESEASIRKHVPLGLTALDRLVSVADYQDFCASFAGIGKARSALFTGPEGPLVHVTLAGSADAPLDENSALWHALTQSLRLFGDPAQPFMLAPRRLHLALVVARIGVDPAYQWVELEPRLRAAVLDRFGFEQRDLGQTIYVSEVISTMQEVAGVDHVDLRCLVGIAQPFSGEVLQEAARSGIVADIEVLPAHVDLDSGARRIVSAELAVISGAVADMLLLTPSQP